MNTVAIQRAPSAGRRLVKSWFSPNVRRALRNLQLEWHIQRLHRSGVHAARKFAGQRGLKLNLGSGYHPKPGWVNVDLFAPTADLRLDLRERLPFANDSVDVIYCEHFFEHLSYPNLDDGLGWEVERPGHGSDALTFLRDCLRILAPGGALDVVVPDVEGIIRQYVDRGQTPFLYDDWWGPKWCDTVLHCVNYTFRQGTEHKYAYDDETLQRILRNTGFVNVQRRPFDPSLDAENHRIGSLCILARKATGDERAVEK